MNIEKHITNLKKYIEEDFAFREPIKNMSDFDRYCWNHCKDIEAVLTAYEKEREKNKEILLGNIENFQKYFLEEFNKKFISIDKLKEIVDECIPKKENIITRELEYTPNANANSYLTQEILSLVKEE